MCNKREAIISSAIECINKDTNVLVMMKFLKNLVDNLSSYATALDTYTKDDAIKFIYHKQNIVDVIIKNIQKF